MKDLNNRCIYILLNTYTPIISLCTVMHYAVLESIRVVYGLWQI